MTMRDWLDLILGGFMMGTFVVMLSLLLIVIWHEIKEH